MKKYVIFNAGLDYNDEIYSVGGEGGGVEKTGYNSVEDAKLALREKYVDLMKPHPGRYDYSYSLNEFSYYGDDTERAWDLIDDGLFGDDERFQKDSYGWRQGPHYHEIIAECEKQNIDWLPYMPEIFQIVEVEFDE